MASSSIAGLANGLFSADGANYEGSKSDVYLQFIVPCVPFGVCLTDLQLGDYPYIFRSVVDEGDVVVDDDYGLFDTTYIGGGAGGILEVQNLEVKNNKVTLKEDAVAKDVYGGYSFTKVARGNKVYFQNGKVSGSLVGAFSLSGNADENSVEIGKDDASKEASVQSAIGGDSLDGNAIYNKITMSGGKIDWLIGGNSKKGEAYSNSISITGGDISGDVYGGVSAENITIGNQVSIENGNFSGGISEDDGLIVGGKGIQALNNSVTITGGSFGTFSGSIVYGGLASRNANENSVSVSGSIKDAYFNYIIGGYSTGAAALKNKVKVDIALADTLSANVIGGKTIYGTAMDNEVELLASSKVKKAYGGYSTFGIVENNTLRAKGEAREEIAGGFSERNQVVGNKVIITEKAKINKAYGGNSVFGFVKDNAIEMSGAEAKELVAGHSSNAEAISNKVLISAGSVTSKAFAGYSTSKEARLNEISISGSAKVNEAYAGYSVNGNSSQNTINMSGGEADKLIAGYSTSKEASLNEISISGSAKAKEVYAGFAPKASTNTLNIKGGEIENAYAGYGTNSLLNVLNINAGKLNNAYAGYSVNGNSSQNTLNIKGGEIENAYAGYSQNGAVSANSVFLTAGKVTGELIGGYTTKGAAVGNTVIVNKNADAQGKIIGAQSDDGHAAYNTIKMNGGEIKYEQIIGGYSKKGDAYNNEVLVNANNISVSNSTIIGGKADNGNAINNIISLAGEGFVYDKLSLYGGVASSGYDALRGNTLRVYNKNITIKEIANFHHYDFVLPYDISFGDTMLYVQDKVYFAPQAEIWLDISDVGKQLSNMKVGDEIVLINATNGVSGETPEYAKLKSGIALQYTFGVHDEAGTKVVAKFDDVRAAEEAKTLSEGVTAAAALITEASDLAAGAGMDSAVKSANSATSTAGAVGLENFGAIGASSSRRQTGSYVDTKSIGFIVGVAARVDSDAGRLIIGPFFEAGYTSYKTHNDYSFGPIDGDGHARYFGVGALARFEFNALSVGMPYIEGSLRMGHNRNKLNASELKAQYEMHSAYYGAHFGAGFVWDIKDIFKLDTYAKYFYNHLPKNSAVVRYDRFDFEAINSHKLLAGARLRAEYESKNDYIISPYVGGGFEHEFGGAAKAFVYGYAIDTPTLAGNSGKGELGVVIGKKGSGLKADFGVNGYVGLRRGLGGNLAIKYEF